MLLLSYQLVLLTSLYFSLKRIQCNGLVDERLSMQHEISEDNNLSHSHEKAGEHDNVNKLQDQQKSSSPPDLVIDSVPEVKETREQGTITEHPHPVRLKKGVLLQSRFERRG